ncbi:MAG: spore coat protein [Clostridia bacterium]|jgi:spore coat protein CotF|nr:spore coat protein [Clostridia bacterium]MBQ1555509.1 spore coat protein [Clostridia bacterium]MBQ1615956.1 spore coat protein [Ruminococcus sp.]MBQ4397220.1 spore coat protein [Clostridia bacterium]MBQ5544775.1 spore coat protein [Clostridia bacterium]
MNDKELMENMLLLEKGSCDLYMHGTIEAANPDISRTFNRALNDSLSMQSTIYSKMSQRGWYAPSQAQPNQISSVKQQFSAQS